MFATGVFANWDSSAKASIFLCSCFKKEGKLAMIRPAKEISFSSTSIPAWPANAFIIGSREYVANAGASSVFVYVIVFDWLLISLYFNENRSPILLAPKKW